MKGIRLLYLKNLRFLFFFACLIVAFSVNAQERKQLVILHTNDTHSTIIPIKETVADTLLAGRGGTDPGRRGAGPVPMPDRGRNAAIIGSVTQNEGKKIPISAK